MNLKDIKSDLLTALKSQHGFISQKDELSDYSGHGLRSEINSKDYKSDPLLKSSKIHKEGKSLPADDDKYGFMDMVVSSDLKIRSSDYNSGETLDSEGKPTFSGSEGQGRLGLYKSTGINVNFSKDNCCGIHTSRRKEFLQRIPDENALILSFRLLGLVPNSTGLHELNFPSTCLSE